MIRACASPVLLDEFGVCGTRSKNEKTHKGCELRQVLAERSGLGLSKSGAGRSADGCDHQYDRSFIVSSRTDASRHRVAAALFTTATARRLTRGPKSDQRSGASKGVIAGDRVSILL